jgi:WD40 repeat protein
MGYIIQVALSPDNRYLVMTGRGGIRVWDLQNLPETLEDRDPILAFAGGYSVALVRFIDNMTLETTSRDGEVQYWSITTGQEVGQP